MGYISWLKPSRPKTGNTVKDVVVNLKLGIRHIRALRGHRWAFFNPASFPMLMKLIFTGLSASSSHNALYYWKANILCLAWLLPAP